jgi:hypothetical protein
VLSFILGCRLSAISYQLGTNFTELIAAESWELGTNFIELIAAES